MEMRTLDGDTSSQKEIIMSSQFHVNQPSLFVSLMVGLLVVIDIILTAVLLGRSPIETPYVAPSSAANTGPAAPVINFGAGFGSSSGSGGAQMTAEKTYLLAYGHDFGAYEYIDDGGYHRGFFRELMSEVCTAAGVKCKAVFDKYTNCWESNPGQHPTLGVGLEARYYDGWIGWQPTIERIHAASFSLPFTDANSGFFYVIPGSTFALNNFVGKKIAFIEGYADNEKCLARQLKQAEGIPLTLDQIKYGTDAAVLYDMLVSGEVDAIFGTIVAMGNHASNGDLQQVDGSELKCVLGGLSIMSRADSEFPAIWNYGFQQIVTNGQFTKLCDKGNEDHGDKGVVECIQSYDWNV